MKPDLIFKINNATVKQSPVTASKIDAVVLCTKISIIKLPLAIV